MYFKANGKQMACNLDWVSFSVLKKEKEPVICCPEGYRMEILQGNNIFKNRAILYKDGEKCLTLLWEPYSSTINKHIMTVQIANSFLYETFVSSWFSVVSECVECTFNSFSRVDICVDFEISDRQLKLIRKLNNGSCYVAAKSEGAKFWHSTTLKGVNSTFPHCLSWGAPTSQFKWKLYNKSREQNVAEGCNPKSTPEKPYIVQMWRDGGMDIKKIWRLELSMEDCGILKSEGKLMGLEFCDDIGRMLEIFRSQMDRRFVIRKSQGHKRKNEDEQVNLLYLEGWRTKIDKKEPNQHPKEKPESVSALRSILRAVESPIVMTDPIMFDYYNDMADLIVQRHRLTGWCMRSLGCGIDEWFDHRRELVGEGRKDGFVSVSRYID